MTVRETSTTPPLVQNEMVPCNSHSLGPWPKARDIRLFSYRDTVFKIRLIMSQIEGGDQCEDLNNVNVHSDIDRCIATLLKNPPSRSTFFIPKIKFISWKKCAKNLRIFVDR